MRVLLADPEGNVRYGLAALLEEVPDLEVIGEAALADELAAQLQGLCPDLLLLSWEFPGVAQGVLIGDMRKTCPNLCIVVLSARAEVKQAALSAGADGFISKSDPPQQLLADISSISERRIKSGLEGLNRVE